jgi:hypothetical protein
MRRCVLILEKPITPEEFDALIEHKHLTEANTLIKSLNKQIERRELTMQWGSSPEPDAVIAIVNDHYKKFGWAGVIQHMITNNNTRKMTEAEIKEGTIPGKVIITVFKERNDESKT